MMTSYLKINGKEALRKITNSSLEISFKISYMVAKHLQRNIILKHLRV